MKKHPNIAAAWNGYRQMVLHPNAPALQVSECRMAFYAGCATLFHVIMTGLDPGDEPTDDDMARMDAMYAEIDEFSKTFDAEVMKRHGGKQ